MVYEGNILCRSIGTGDEDAAPHPNINVMDHIIVTREVCHTTTTPGQMSSQQQKCIWQNSFILRDTTKKLDHHQVYICVSEHIFQ